MFALRLALGAGRGRVIRQLLVEGFVLALLGGLVGLGLAYWANSLLVASMRGLAGAAKAGDAARFRDAPLYAPRRRLDETKAAREPRLRWTPPDVRKEAAE